MAIEVGAAYLSILPTTDKLAPGIKTALKVSQKVVDAAGKDMGSSIAKGITAGAKDSSKAVKSALQDTTKVADREGKASGKRLKDGIAAGLKGTEKDAAGAGKKIGEGLERSAKRAFNVRNLYSGLDKGALSAGQGIGGKLATGIKGGVQKLMPTVKTALTAGLAGVAGIGTFGIKVAADTEQAQIAFATLLKDGKRAEKELAWLTKQAAVTPFETKDLITMDKTLLNFGFTSDDVRHKWVLNMGNIAAAVGLPSDRLGDMSRLFGQVKASGTISMEDVNQAIDMGIPIWDALGKQTGKSVQAMRKDISNGKVTAETFFTAMDSYTGKNFNNAMDAQSKSVSGMWSSIKDNFSQGAAKLVTPLIPLIKNAMPGVSDALGKIGAQAAIVTPKLIGFAGKVKDGITGLFNILVKGDFTGAFARAFGIQEDAPIVGLLLKVHDGLSWTATWFMNNAPVVAAFAGTILGLGAAVKLWGLATSGLAIAQSAFNGLMIVWKVLTTEQTAAQLGLNAAMSANVIGLVVLALAALVAGVVFAWTHFEGFRTVVLAVWAGIQTAIGFAWNNVIKPVFTALAWFITTIIGPAVSFLWSTIIKPYFTLIGNIIKGVWDRFIFPVFQFLVWNLKNVVGPAFSWLWSKVISPVFGWIGSHISDQWNRVIKPVLSALGGFIQDKVAPAFQKGIDKIGKIWETMKAIALAPVNFVIDTVYNNGIRKLINALPGVDDVPPLGLLGQGKNAPGNIAGGGHTPSKFAKGGGVFGPGTGTSDSIPARLSKGEHVWTAKEVKAAGGQKRMLALRQAVLRGGLGNTFDPPAFATGGTLSADAVAKAKKFAKDHEGNPYGWGSVGPSSFDCSGFMSALTNVLRGSNPFSRVGATGSFPWSGFEPGPGQFTIGSTKNYGGSGVGHMAGTLEGMNVESRGGKGVVTGSAARGYNDSGFNTVAHLGAAGAGAAGTDGGFLESIKNVLKSLKGWISELANMGGFGGMIKQMVQAVGGKIKEFINDKVPGPGPLSGGIFDQGGILAPGAVAFNASKKPEAVFNQQQFKQYAENAAGNKSLPTTTQLTITNWKDGTGYFREVAGQEIDDAADYAASGNRRNR